MKSYDIVSRFISFYLMSFSFSETAKKFDVHPNVIRYYVKKFFHPKWHSGTWGGARRKTFHSFELKLVHQVVIVFLQSNPHGSLSRVRAFLQFFFCRSV